MDAPRRSIRPTAPLKIRVSPRFRPAVEEIRAGLDGLELRLFDLLCLAADIGFRLPQPDVNLERLSGPADPRRRFARGMAKIVRGAVRETTDHEWSNSGVRLARLLIKTLSNRDLTTQGPDGKYEPLSVFLAYAPSGLALDCTIPAAPIPRAAWKTVVEVFAALFPSDVARIRLDWIDRRRLNILTREAAAGRRKGRAASGERPGPSGRRLALDPRLLALVSKALGKAVVPAYEARYVFYTRPGDYFWPHPDDPEIAVNVFICLEHKVPRGCSTRSAFLAYRADGSVERHELTPGHAIAAETQGLMHAREPMRRGERVTLLAIALHLSVPKSSTKRRRQALSTAMNPTR
ncbi:MAG: hypothetical protein H7X97_04450 [Opitutaceae bacterium]|nr:hypothetical protein [Verrucomicrobiales bacterium]